MRYEWKFGPAEVYSNSTFTDAVSHVTWYCIGYAQDGRTFKDSGAVKLDPPDTNQFKPFTAINEAVVRSWVFGKISQSAIEAKLAGQAVPADNGTKQFNF